MGSDLLQKKACFWTHILPHFNGKILSGSLHKYIGLEKENLTKMLGPQIVSDQLQ